MTIDQADPIDLRAWLTSELWSSEFKIMVRHRGPAEICSENGVIKYYDEVQTR